MLMLTNQGQSAPFFTSFDGQLGSHSVELPSGTALVLMDLAALHSRMRDTGFPHCSGCRHSAILSHSVELPSGTALVLMDLAAPHSRMRDIGFPHCSGCGHSVTLSSLTRTEETERASSTITTSQRSKLHNAECRVTSKIDSLKRHTNAVPPFLTCETRHYLCLHQTWG